ncbi:uncharacterized protein LACBIDRAFT_307608 [Laccaria bicolor S238N-H82]|uniref:Predicted protein n=1 Tax=Laccaria bicolor (strain S238N-H82 / ATCC MYA-4686) TaxID=486041 RepID=B0DQK1_LACBS|nr:uncharacterized protein LACBIDRAFT_307608 [Laccaria bicolor S238N-H82]EDR03128.1 predicted protein [Laccaria bicolor S238N-H82]|eukprot:XP_001886269.1 predicted protein [Laccaria bicolor S238N-H82]
MFKFEYHTVGFLSIPAGIHRIPGFQPESAESSRNQWRNGKYCLNLRLRKAHHISSSTSMFSMSTDCPANTNPGLKVIPSAQQLSMMVTSLRFEL